MQGRDPRSQLDLLRRAALFHQFRLQRTRGHRRRPPHHAASAMVQIVTDSNRSALK